MTNAHPPLPALGFLGERCQAPTLSPRADRGYLPPLPPGAEPVSPLGSAPASSPARTSILARRAPACGGPGLAFKPKVRSKDRCRAPGCELYADQCLEHPYANRQPAPPPPIRVPRKVRNDGPWESYA